MIYGNYASKIFSTNGGYVKLIDEKGMEWACTVEYNELPYVRLELILIIVLPCICVFCMIVSVLAGNFLLCPLIELYCHVHFHKQTLTAAWSLHDKWMNISMCPIEILTMDPNH
jgi:hypothetical protein